MIILILTSAILAFLSVDGTPVTALQSHSNYHVYRYGHANVHIACLNKCKKARVCPSVTDSVNTTCTNSCTTVADCPSQHQCCNNSCGRQCQPEVPFTQPKFRRCFNLCSMNRHRPSSPPRCPVIVPPEVDTTNQTCADDCSEDLECFARLKCCDTGCGKRCVVGEDSSCVSNGKVYQNGEQLPTTKRFQCLCKDGRVTCTTRRQQQKVALTAA